VRPRLPAMAPWQEDAPALAPVANRLDANSLDAAARQRLLGRYGALAPQVVAAAQPGELTPIGDTPSLWAELRWAARAEQVVHLEDLLLRRLRIGLIAPEGAARHAARIQTICQEELGWDDARWQEEWTAYRELWRCCYAPPDPALVPPWEPLTQRPEAARSPSRRLTFRRLAPTGALVSLLLLLLGWLRRRR
jgi:glycerol-3-phosphate dehydrogenase